MKHTRPATLIGLGVVALAVGFVLDSILVANGQAAIVPPVPLGLVLLAIGGIVVSMAVPVRKVARGTSTERIDPYYATRVLLLAKASSLSGALFGGAAGGVLLFMLTRGVSVALGSLVPTIIAVVGGLALLAAGIVAERMCTVPPGDDDDGGPGAQPV
ncbi:DUF3180 domain-containing protein [Frigoribacterium faeni]|uniref:DUF3180 domain-containing protein n=1 Tax=Frigoribacterium faeni TaxID=145483 RepID=A0A7W3PJW9_9MICO|nr:DUF3180 domain-containing protein [Frigoribacterium faeni]MBA8814935.1 hypothetical protein [Frigoribacterium faeni]GEK83018.1 hypothetical protein FFA01_13270 [Frigoribacterium faeni]